LKKRLFKENIILSVESIEEEISLWADPSMLEKIIFNLLSNAFKATKDNGIVSIKNSSSIKAN